MPRPSRPSPSASAGPGIPSTTWPSPGLFSTVLEGLATSGLNAGARVVVEKPFGRDLITARELNRILHEAFAEPAILRKRRADRALVRVSIVPNVFEDTTKRVSAGSRSWVDSQKSAPSTLETKRSVRALPRLRLDSYTPLRFRRSGASVRPGWPTGWCPMGELCLASHPRSCASWLKLSFTLSTFVSCRAAGRPAIPTCVPISHVREV